MGLLDDAIREHLDLKRRRGADPAEVERAEQEALGPVRRGPIEAEPPEMVPADEPPELILDEEHQPAWDDEYEDEDLPDAPAAGGAVSYLEPDASLEPPAGTGPGRFAAEVDPFGDEGPTEPGPPPPARAGQGYGEPDSLHEPGPPDYLHEPEPARPVERYDEGDPTQVPLDESAPPPHRAPPLRDQGGETVEYDVEEALGEPGGRTRGPAPHPAQNPPAGAEEDPLEETPEFLQETPDHDRLWFEQRPPRDFDFDG